MHINHTSSTFSPIFKTSSKMTHNLSSVEQLVFADVTVGAINAIAGRGYEHLYYLQRILAATKAMVLMPKRPMCG